MNSEEKKLKVLYISGPAFLDMDLSFVKALAGQAECIYLMDLYPKLHKATALNLNGAPRFSDVIPMSEVRELSCYECMIDLNHSYIINRIKNNPLSWSNFLLQWKLFWFVRKHKPDVIHFNNLIYFNHFYLFWWRKNTIISIHDPFPHTGEEHHANTISAKCYNWLNRLLIHHHLLYNDIMVEEYASDRKISMNRIVTSSLGPYEYFAKTIPEPSAPSNFLFFGRIQDYKGVDVLLTAFKALLNDFPDATLTVAGSGEFSFDLSEFNIPDRNLRVLNRFIPSEELAGLIHQCQYIVCPYKDATQSGVVMTAYAFCKPVIVTNVGALPIYVEDGKTGLVVNPNDPDDLRLAMSKALRGELNPDLARAEIHKIFHQGARSWSSIASRLIKKYKKLILK